MKNNFKGYTLVELLLSLAVFSIVMIIIGGVVSSTSTMYRNESFEVTMQEDASLVIAQLDELLMDATSFEKLASGYKLTNSGQKYIIYSSGKNLYIHHGDDLSTGETEVLSDCIWIDPAGTAKSFEISGFTTTTTSPDCDNAVLVSLDFDKEGYTYHAEKQVYLRNNLENANANVITSTIGSSSSTGGTSSTPECDVKRYAVVDLDTLYGTNGGWDFTSDAGSNKTNFVFCKQDGSALGTGDAKRYIKLVDTVNSSHTTSFSKSDNIKIKSGTKEVYLTVDAVSFDDGAGVLILPAIKSNHGSLDTFNIKGLDLYALNSQHAGQSKVSSVLYYDSNGNKTFDSGENTYLGDTLHLDNASEFSVKFDKTLKNYYIQESNGEAKYEGDVMQFSNNGARVIVCADQFGRGFALNYPETQIQTKGKMNDFAGGKIRYAIRFDLYNSQYYYYVDFQTFCAGNVMTNKTGGKTYKIKKTEVPSGSF